jgi:hypothetical protein
VHYTLQRRWLKGAKIIVLNCRPMTKLSRHKSLRGATVAYEYRASGFFEYVGLRNFVSTHDFGATDGRQGPKVFRSCQIHFATTQSF